MALADQELCIIHSLGEVQLQVELPGPGMLRSRGCAPLGWTPECPHSVTKVDTTSLATPRTVEPTGERHGMQGTMLEQVVDHRLDVPHDG